MTSPSGWAPGPPARPPRADRADGVLPAENGKSLLSVTSFDDPVVGIGEHVICHEPDERFVREGDDLFSTVDLTVTQAALGATVSVPTLGGDEELEFQPGTQPGEIRVLRGRGMPAVSCAERRSTSSFQ